MAKKKTKAQTTGTLLEGRVAAICKIYRAQGVADLEKVDPPTVKTRWATIYKASPFLDYIGTWNARGGRMIALEAKSVDVPRLRVCVEKGAGLSVEQIDNLRRWEASGAAVGVIWFRGGDFRFVTLAQIDAARADEYKSVDWLHCYRIPKTEHIEADFLAVLNSLYPCISLEKQTNCQPKPRPDPIPWPEPEIQTKLL